MDELLPWQHPQWRRLKDMKEGERFPHALLLRGPRGHGKYTFARYAANALVCEHKDIARPCGICRGCRLFATHTHPDVVTVSPLEGKRGIGIDQIRALIDAVWLTRQYAKHKVAIIAPAEALTSSAANSLLKTLEEPPGETVFLLVSHLSTLLPATVRSRCQFLNFSTPPTEVARDWLAGRVPPGVVEPGLLLDLANGAPIAALALLEEDDIGTRTALLDDLVGLASGRVEPVTVAARWNAMGVTKVLNWLIAHSIDMIRLKSVGGRPSLSHRDLGVASLQQAIETLDLKKVYHFVDRCMEARRVVEGPYALNEQLLLEAVAIEWVATSHT